jgi:hypothetical protein
MSKITREFYFDYIEPERIHGAWVAISISIKAKTLFDISALRCSDTEIVSATINETSVWEAIGAELQDCILQCAVSVAQMRFEEAELDRCA